MDAGLFDGRVQALVQGATGNRLQHVTVLPRVQGSGVRIERFLALPDLDDCEVIRAHRMLQDVEPQTSLFLAAGFSQSFEQPRCVGLSTANGVDMGNDVNPLAVPRYKC